MSSPYLAPRVVPGPLDLIPEHTVGQEGGDANCEVPARAQLQVRLGHHSQIVDAFSKTQILWVQNPRGQSICKKEGSRSARSLMETGTNVMGEKDRGDWAGKLTLMVSLRS